jgi:hypothetical protein
MIPGPGISARPNQESLPWNKADDDRRSSAESGSMDMFARILENQDAMADRQRSPVSTAVTLPERPTISNLTTIKSGPGRKPAKATILSSAEDTSERTRLDPTDTTNLSLSASNARLAGYGDEDDGVGEDAHKDLTKPRANKTFQDDALTPDPLLATDATGLPPQPANTTVAGGNSRSSATRADESSLTALDAGTPDNLPGSLGTATLTGDLPESQATASAHSPNDSAPGAASANQTARTTSETKATKAETASSRMDLAESASVTTSENSEAKPRGNNTETAPTPEGASDDAKADATSQQGQKEFANGQPFQEPSRNSAQDGMSDASSKVSMNLTDKMKQFAPQKEQVLPKAGKDVSEKEALASVKEAPTSSLSTANAFVSSSGVVSTPAPTSLVTATAPAVNATGQVEKLTELVARQVVELKQVNALQMTAVLRPDAQTELHLSLRLSTNGVEVHARCESASEQTLGEQWNQIQQALAPQGIRLSALNDPAPRWANQHDFGGSPGATSQQSSDRQEARRQLAPASIEEDTTLITAGPTMVARRNTRTPRADGLRWESWA